MQYETLDSKQLDDIMDGKPPRPPSGWDDKQPPSGGASSTDADEETSGKTSGGHTGPIGGPASPH